MQKIKILNGRARRPLYQVIQAAHEDDSPAGDADGDIAKIGVGHMFGGREMFDDAYERL